MMPEISSFSLYLAKAYLNFGSGTKHGLIFFKSK